jgi:hypothetical protein
MVSKNMHRIEDTLNEKEQSIKKCSNRVLIQNSTYVRTGILRWTEHVARMGAGEAYVQNFGDESGHLEDLVVGLKGEGKSGS